MAFLEIANLHKTFGVHTALHHFEMEIERGEFVTFLGPSGCGKTTVLRMIAGFESPTRGVIRLDVDCEFRASERSAFMARWLRGPQYPRPSTNEPYSGLWKSP